MKKEVVIITAFHNIGRAKWEGEVNGVAIPDYIKRDEETYLKHFERLAKLGNRIVLFCDPHLSYLEDKYSNVMVFPLKFDLKYQQYLDKIKEVQSRREFIDFVTRKSAPEYWSPEYVMINFLKTYFIRVALMSGIIEPDDTTAWIDFGYCRRDEHAPEGKTFTYDDGGKIHMFLNGIASADELNKKPIFDIIRSGEVLIQGCHLIGPAKELSDMFDGMQNTLNRLLNVGLVDDDQTLLLMCYRDNPDKFILNHNSSADWFNVIMNNC